MRVLVLILGLFLPVAWSVTLQCGGTVQKIGLHAPDRVMLQLSSMNTAVFICHLKRNWVVAGTGYQTSANT